MATLQMSVTLELSPSAAFDLVLNDLSSALSRKGIQLQAQPDGRVTQNGVEIGRVTDWSPQERVLIAWRGADWTPENASEVELRFEPLSEGTRVLIEHRGWGAAVGEAGDLAAWFAGEIAASFLAASAPEAVGDWFTDRWARRPSGPQARAIYRDPLYHYPNFRVILAELDLTPEDNLLEVGCGGGALLKSALEGGCRAAAIDHSPDMVRLARETNQQAVNEGRLEVKEGDAASLPFPDATFTCAAMTGVLGFLADPVQALSEIRRVLKPGGRFVVLGSDPELKGTPGAPEPMASRLQFYDDDELEELGRRAGFPEVEAVRRDMYEYAREAGVPEEHLPLFAGAGARFLLCRNQD